MNETERTHPMYATLEAFLHDAGIDAPSAVSLLRVVASVADGDSYAEAVSSFSDPDAVHEAALRLARHLYH